jgi:lipopolysaccharide/colanic/teichoic acid biosynthesis glycosyltransferase
LNNIKDIIVSSKVKNVFFAKEELSIQQILDLMWDLRNYNLFFKILTSDKDIVLGKSPLDKIDDIYLIQIEYNINKKINIFVKRIFDLTFAFFFLIFIYPPVFLYLKAFNADPRHHKFLKKILLVPQVISGKLSIVGRATWDTTSTGKQYLGKNGLTGLVQINYYKNLNKEEIDYYNFYYAKNQSFALDMEIILKTISLYLFRKKVIQL